MPESPRKRNRRELERAEGNLDWYASHIFKVLYSFIFTVEVSQENPENTTQIPHNTDNNNTELQPQNTDNYEEEEEDNTPIDIAAIMAQLDKIPERYHKYRDALVACLDMAKMLQDMTEQIRANL